MAKRKKQGLVLGLVVLLIIGGIGIYSAFSSNNKNEQALAKEKDDKESSNENKIEEKDIQDI